MIQFIELTGAAGIALMLAHCFGAKRWCAVVGQLLVLMSFALISFALYRGGSYWVASGFAVGFLIPIYMTLAG